MTEEEISRYNEAMRQGHYLTGLDIVLRANAPEGISDEELYAPILDNVFPAELAAEYQKLESAEEHQRLLREFGSEEEWQAAVQRDEDR